MVGGGIARQIRYIARASALPRAVFLLLPRAVRRLAAMALGVDFTVTSRFRGNRRAHSQDGSTHAWNARCPMEASLLNLKLLFTRMQKRRGITTLWNAKTRVASYQLQLRTALAVADKLCTCRSLPVDVVQLTSSKVRRFAFGTACSPHTYN